MKPISTFLCSAAALALFAGCDGSSVVGGIATEAGIDVVVVDIPVADVPRDVPADVPFRCRDNASCAGNPGGPACDVATGRCVACVPGADTCPAGTFCDPATIRCAPGCRNDEGCAPGVRGDAGVGDGGASPGRRCNIATRACVQCLGDGDCPAGTLCMGNTCVAGCTPTRACPMGQTCCSGGCVDTATNVANCGACGARCEPARAAPVCAAGACGVASCVAPFGDCDGNAANGCEVDTSANVAHCGGCGMACAARPGATATCETGRCVYACASGFGDCDGNPSNGCEVALATSAAHCGACGMACAFSNAAATCVARACTLGACNAGFGNCDNDATNGCETDTRVALSHCGACGTACPARANATPTCAAGACGVACNAGFGNCDNNATNGCETVLATSVMHCGACGNACGANQDCVSGACVTRATCTDRVQNGTETDVDCGGTCPGCGGGFTCRAGTDCQSGACTAGRCDAPTCSPCFDGTLNGSETDVDCGGSCDARCVVGARCAANADCLSGVCTAGRCAGTDPTTNANGGGGGGGQTQCWAAGGGGGGHGSAGGDGSANTVCAASRGGESGAAYGEAALTRIFFGSGGGGGGDDYRDPSWEGLDGGNGGGIVMIAAASLTVTGSITARGADGTCVGGAACVPGGGFDGGGGGGGAGGSVLLSAAAATLGGTLVRATGGAPGWVDTSGFGGAGAVGRVAVLSTTAMGSTEPAAFTGATLIPLGSGADGAATVTGMVNLNTASIAAGRTAPDGEAFPVSALGATTITVGDAGTGGTAANNVGTSIRAGDSVLLINLRGAPGASANVGRYELLTVQSVSGATITVGAIANTYGATSNAGLAGQSVMVQRVPSYSTVTVTGRLSASAFDGRVGGVIAFRATGAVNVMGSIDASALGYRGGAGGRQCDNCGRQGESFTGRGARVCRTGPITPNPT